MTRDDAPSFVTLGGVQAAFDFIENKSGELHSVLQRLRNACSTAEFRLWFMELLEGCSLATRLRDGALSINEAVPVCLGVLAALDALHTRGLVHRDVKPSNVFLTPHAAKQLDFGLAKSVAVLGDDAPGATREITQSGVVIGTPRYMSPEQLQGGTVVTHHRVAVLPAPIRSRYGLPLVQLTRRYQWLLGRAPVTHRQIEPGRVPALRHDAFLAAVRNRGGFSELLAEAEAHAASVARAFGEGGGPRALSVN